jgi:hypothetical protein
MSAFIVGREHIDALLRLGLAPPMIGPLRWFDGPPQDEWTLSEFQEHSRTLTLESADEVGRMLWAENVRSIHYRYPDTLAGGTYPGPNGFSAEEAFEYTYPVFGLGRQPSPVEGLKLIDCLEYQSCEHPQWRSSEAFQFCDALCGRLINRLPGYALAPWEWRPEAVTA